MVVLKFPLPVKITSEPTKTPSRVLLPSGLTMIAPSPLIIIIFIWHHHYHRHHEHHHYHNGIPVATS